MSFEGQNLSPSGYIPPNSSTLPPLGMRVRDNLDFIVGTVQDVDEDRYAMTIEASENIGIFNNIPIYQPFAGTGSYIGGMPEIGSTVILAKVNGTYSPLCYIPNYDDGLDFKNTRIYPDGINPPQSNEMFFRFPKLRRGQVAMSSSEAAEVFLGDRVQLKQMLRELVVDGKLDHIAATSINNYLFSGGVWRNAGIITRNSLKKSNTDDGHFAEVEPLGDGSSRCRLRLAPEDGRLFSEYLVEVEDVSFEEPPMNEVNSSSSDTARNPVAVFSMGNLVGNNSTLDNYGKVLKVGLFNSSEDDEGQFTFEPLVGDDALKYGMAISLFNPLRRNPEIGSFMGIDKEGHFYQYVPSASCGGLGKGRSISIVARGSKKEIFGKDSKRGNSWDLVTEGGIRWVVGNHNERDGNQYYNRSIDVRTTSTAFYMYGGTDPEVKDFEDDQETLETRDLRKYGKIEKVDGNERHEVEGNRETIVRSSEKLQIAGMKHEAIAGACTMTVGQDLNIVVTSVFAEKVIKEKQETFGSRLTSITSGDSELEIKAPVGGIKETITKLGYKMTSVATGSISEDIKAGDKSVNIKVGNYGTKIKTGTYSVNVKTGSIDLKTDVGVFIAESKIDASLVASLAGTASVEGGSINLKSKEKLMGGVVTDKTHFDYITGAPLVGSKTVKAAGLPG